MDTFQIHRDGADGTDAVEAKLHAARSADLLEGIEIVQDAGGSLAMDAPEPGGAALVQLLREHIKIKRTAAFGLEHVELEPKAAGMVNQAFPELAIREDEARLFIERQLRGDDVVPKRTRAQQNFDAGRARQAAEELLGSLQIFDEGFGAMRFGRFLESPPDRAADGDRAGQQIHHVAIEIARGARAEKSPRARLEGFDAHVHRLELGALVADQRTERDEAQVVVELALAGGAREDGEVVAVFDEILPNHGHESLKDLAGAILAVHRQQAEFANIAARRQV